MAHDEHNKRKSGGFLLIILGALIFFLAPTYLTDSPELGGAAIAFGFIIGGIGFYMTFLRKRKRP